MALPQATLDFQLSPSESAKDAQGVLNGMVLATQKACSSPQIAVRQDVAYGQRARQKLDVFRPIGAAGNLPCLVFIHGGFWQEGDKSVSGFAAQTFADLGWAYVALGYTLTPDITLQQIMIEIREALDFMQAHAPELGIDPDRIVLAGHSAGGHLAASILANLPAAPNTSLPAGAVLISGVFDLAPIAKSYVSALTPIRGPDIAALSPLRHPPAGTVPLHVLVGGDEPEAFQAQSAALIGEWGPLVADITAETVPGRDHFDILFELANAESQTVQRIRAMV